MPDRNELERLLAAEDAAETLEESIISASNLATWAIHNGLSLMDDAYRWKQNALAYIATAAVQYAKERGLPDGHLHPHHYDLMEQAGGYMDSFTRAEIGETHDN